jgi:hypothetical protein
MNIQDHNKRLHAIKFKGDKHANILVGCWNVVVNSCARGLSKMVGNKRNASANAFSKALSAALANIQAKHARMN